MTSSATPRRRSAPPVVALGGAARPFSACADRVMGVKEALPAPGAGEVTVCPSEPDLLADEDDVDAAGQFLVDLEDLPDLAVLPVGGLGAGVLQRQAVP